MDPVPSRLSGYSSGASLTPRLRLAKSTLTLIPLLGIHHMVFIFVTDESTLSTISLRLTKLFIDLFFSSFQVRHHLSSNTAVSKQLVTINHSGVWRWLARTDSFYGAAGFGVT